MVKIAVKSLSEQGILPKLAVSIMLMAIIPLLLFLYLLYSEVPFLLQKDSVQWTIFLIICAVTSGYLLSRKIITAMLKLTKQAKAVVQGDLRKQIDISEKNEINMLAQYFNQIKDNLEKNIEELKESKKLMQNVLLRIGSALSSTEKIESILELTIETLTNALNASSGLIMHLEKEKLRLMVAYGLEHHGLDALELKPGQGVIGWVSKEKKALKVSRIQQDRRFDSEVKIGLAHQSIICAPLIYQDKIIGTISVQDKKQAEEFSEDDLILLKNLANQTGVAIENSFLHADIERSYVETISALALAVEAKDPYSRGHAKRVSEYVTLLAKEFNLDKDAIRTLQDAAVLHDIGKIGIKDEILLKATALTAEEKMQMHRHAIIGENILNPVHSLNKVAYLVRHHQEQSDGKGYPDGLTGEEMTLPLEILIAADAFDAMTSDRPYRKAMSHTEAKQELKKYSGVYFNPQVVEKFLQII